uniref:hypothetical protein n=1 Tax=unclassified Variovorax TaxID=663243 RepID=UPI00140549D0
MNFSTDGGGFAFSCDDLKLSIDASTWATRLSQLGRMTGNIYIAAGLLSKSRVHLQDIG